MLGEFYRLRTYQGNVVAEDLSSHEISGYAESDIGTDCPALVLYRPNARLNVCFLISTAQNILWVPPGLGGLGILPFGLAHGGEAVVSLYSPDDGSWVSTVPLNDDGPRRERLVITQRKVQASERFTLVPVGGPGALTSFVVETATKVEAMLVQQLNMNLVRSLLPGDATNLQAVARLAPRLQVEELARALLANPRDCQTFVDLFPDDIFGQFGLLPLAHKLAGRDDASRAAGNSTQLRPPQPRHALGLEFERLSSQGLAGEHISLPHTLNALARSTFSPQQDLCIVAIARNEGLYLLDWIAYHRAIGAQAIFLYTNDNDDGSDELLSALAQAGVLHWFDNRLSGVANAQSKAYGHALGLLPEILDYRWSLTIDLDEYLVFNPALFRSAIDFLDWHETNPCDAIALNWVIYGSGGASRWTDDFIARRFRDTAGVAGSHIKSVCRPRRFIHSMPHYPVTFRNKAFTFHAANGLSHVPLSSENDPSFSAQPNAEFAWISHYFFKSTEEFLWKWSRNRSNDPNVRGKTNTALKANFVESFVQQFPLQFEPFTTPDQCAPNFEAEKEFLQTLPGVAEAWEHIKQVYRERIKEIVPMFRNAPAIVEAGLIGQQLLATLDLV